MKTGVLLGGVLSTLCVLTIPVTFSTNIYYMATVGVPNVSNETNIYNVLALDNGTGPEDTGIGIAFFATFVSLLYETFGLAVSTLVCIVVMFKKLSVLLKNLNSHSTDFEKAIMNSLSVQRAVILYFSVIFVPLSHSYFFVEGEARWYVLMVYRLSFYGVIFATTAIVGIGWDDTVNNVTSTSHFVSIAWKLLQMCLKLLVCSSATASYLTVGIQQHFPIRASYFAFTLHRVLTALFIFGTNSLLLHYEVLGEDHRPKNKWDRRIKACVQKWDFLGHVIFCNDLISYGGLTTLTILIVAGGDTSTTLIVSLCLSIFGIGQTVAGYVLTTKFCGNPPIKNIIWDKIKQKIRKRNGEELDQTANYKQFHD